MDLQHLCSWRLRLAMMAITLLLFTAALQAAAETDDPDTVGELAVEEIDEHPRAHRLLEDIEQSIARVEPWLEQYGYAAVFAFVGVEGAGIPAPGLTIIEAGAVMAATDTGSDRQLRIGWLLVVAIAASTLGSMVGYFIGLSGGRGLLNRLPIPARHLGKVETAFQRHGGWFIVFARFFDGPRQLHAIAAGTLHMPWKQFLLFTFIGALLWVGFWMLLVYYIDLHLDQIVHIIRRLNPSVAGLVVALLAAGAVFAFYQLRRRRSTGTKSVR